MSENDPGIQIRAASADDAVSIAGVLHAAFVEYEPQYTPAGFSATTLAAEGVLKRLSEGPIWVALQEGQVVGTVCAYLKASTCYMRGMAIVPAARGQRIGERLLEHVEQFAREQHAERLYLNTTPFLERAIRLYERYGFQRIEEGPLTLFGTPLFAMVKPLRARPQSAEDDVAL